ncbi:hypothetical protein Tco_0970402 [Tanacetum coccineum]
MEREAEFKKQRVFNTGNRVAKPVWTNANRVNHANQFVPKPVQLNAGRAKINSVRPNINTGRTNVNSVRPRVSTVSSNVNTVRSRQPVPTRTSNNFSPKRPQDHPLKNMEETKAQGRKTHDLDPLVSLVQELVTPSKTVNASGEEQIKSVDKGKRYKRRKSLKEFAGTSLDFEEVKYAFEKVNIGGIRVLVPSPDRGRKEGKAHMTEEEETQASRKIKEQILQEEAGLAKAIRLDALEKALEKEEVAKQVHLDSLIAQRMAEEQELTEEQKKRKAQESVLRKDLTVEDYAKRMELYVKLSKESRDMLKKLNFEEVKAEFEKLVKQLDTYVPMNFEATKEKEKIEEDKDDKPTKKTGKRRKQIARKGFHTDHDKDGSEDSDEANEKDDSTSGTKIPINPVPVATKSPSIANYKIIKQGRKGVYQIVRENGTDMVYISFGAMLTDISRDDLTELYRIVMKKHGMNEPEDEFEKVLWEYLKNMFEEPLSTDSIEFVRSTKDNLLEIL